MRISDSHDADFEVRPGTPARSIAEAWGVESLWCGDVRLAPDHPAGIAPLLHGAKLIRDAAGSTVRPGDVYVEVTRGPDAGATVRLADDGVVVGRAHPADLVVSDPALSAAHARLTYESRARVSDLGSTNGPGPRRALRADPPRLRLGRSELTIHGAPPRTPASPTRPRVPLTMAAGAVMSAIVLGSVTGRWWIAACVLAVAVATSVPALVASARQGRARAEREPGADAARTPAGRIAIRGTGGWPAAYARAVALDRGRVLAGVTREPWMRWLSPGSADDRVALLGPGEEPPSWADATVDVGSRGVTERVGTSSRHRLPLAVHRDAAEAAARRLAATAPTDGLPAAVRWGDVDALPDGDRPLTRGAARALTVTLGTGADGPVELDLDRDGPHVLVAGTTGSGKSVALETLVTGLAVAHPPADLAIALIDFKGGAGLAGCLGLPHVCATLTDLDGALAHRALTGLAEELHSRKRALAERDVTSWQQWEALGDAPPRLLVVVDEYQEIASLAPDFVADMARLAAQGRSLGLHLVMATQRPSGAVTPAVRANVGATLALRVASDAESRDLLGRADAASLPRDRPGRAILARGQALTPLQTARALATPSPAVVAVGHTPDPGASLADAASRRWRGHPPPMALWQPPLPSSFAPDVAAVHAADPRAGVVIALADHPRERRVAPVRWHPHEGAFVVVGPPGAARAGAMRAAAIGATTLGFRPVTLPADPREAARTLHLATDPRHLLIVEDAGPALALLSTVDDGAAAEALLERIAAGRPTVLALSPHAPTRLARGARLIAVMMQCSPAQAAAWSVPRDEPSGAAPGRAWVMRDDIASEAQLAFSPGRVEGKALAQPLPTRAPRDAWGVGGDAASPWAAPGGTVCVVGPPGAVRRAVASSIGAHAHEADSPTLAAGADVVVLTEPTPRAVRLLAALDHAGTVDPSPVPGRVVVIAARHAAAVQLNLELGVAPGVDHQGGSRRKGHGHGGDAPGR
ncbi:FHA domain-containing protein [Demequina sp. NBRC 110051]|uniref:FHA domain-containing protein n=1 Tax=Demequina sp. NBRC 110051 TaxID=1570340 RepID=UPI00135662C4|nr:FHA domain-containing protein [Demequina sp. NBRC 110051]